MATSFLDTYQQLVKSWVPLVEANSKAKAAVAASQVEPTPPAVTSPPVTPTPAPVAKSPAVPWVTPATEVTTPTPTTENIGKMQDAITQTETTAQEEVKSQLELTKELNAIDQSQLDTQIKQANVAQQEYKAVQESQMIDKTNNEMEYQKQINEQAQEDAAALKTLQEAETAKNQATAAELKTKNEAAEREMQIQNELWLQKAAISFAKLWLSFSAAAINTATQIYDSWTYNLAKLKTWNAKNYADLQVKINKTEFDHKATINKIIREASDDVFKSKERLREFIWNAQNNILNNKQSTQKQVQDAIDTYKSEKQAREDKMWSDMNKANDRIISATKEYQKTIDFSQETTKKKIDALVSNGQWASLAPEQRVQLERDAWLPAGTTQNTVVAKTTQMITEGLKALTGKAVGVPPNVLNKMHLEVQRMLKLNVPMNTAIQMTIEKYKSAIPQVKQAEDAAKNKALMDAEKAKLDAEYKQSQIDKNIASANKSSQSWGGWKWTTTSKLQSKYFDIETEVGWKELTILGTKIKIPWVKTKKSVQGSYNPVTWDYTYEGKKIVPLKSSTSSSTSTILSLNNPWFSNK